MIAQENFEKVDEMKAKKLEGLKKKRLHSRVASVTFGAMLLLPNVVTTVEAAEAEAGIVETAETVEAAAVAESAEVAEPVELAETAEFAESAKPVETAEITPTDTEATEAAIDLDNSQVILARLGAYGSRYYRITITLVDENGAPVEGLTQTDFALNGFGGLANFTAEGNVYKLDTAEADGLRTDYAVSMIDGVVTVNVGPQTPEEPETPEITIAAPEVYDVATHKSRTVEGMLPENATEIRVYLPGDSEEFRLARILSERPGGGRSFSLGLPDDYSFSAGQEVRVIAADDAGNISEATTKTVLDSKAIAKLTVDSIYPEAEMISGTVNPKATVHVVLPGGPSMAASVKADGSWSVQTRGNANRIVAGETVELRVRVDGNTHNFNQTIEAEPVVVNQPAINNPVSPYASIISVKAEPQTNITLTLPNGEVLSGRTNNWGNLNLNVSENAGLAVGEMITVIASNDQGVSSTPLEYVLPDLVEITQLVVNPILPGEAHAGVSGKAVPGAFVTVHLPRNTSMAARADENGDWFINTVGHGSRLTPGVTVDFSVAIGGVPYRNVVRAEVVEVPGEIDLEASTLVVNRLGFSDARYYQARVTLVDEYGLPVEGLTREDFELVGFGGLVEFSAEGNLYKLTTAEAGELRPDHSLTIEDGKVVVTIVDEREADIDLEKSQTILTRLGTYNDRYYQIQLRLVDELGRPVEGLTQEDFEILGFGGIVNFQADGNYYRLDTAEAGELRPDHSFSLEAGKVVVTIVDEREADIDLEKSQTILTRLGTYNARYYQIQLRLVDELGRPVEGLTQADFEILGFGGIVNFQADGNYYRLDTAEAGELRPDHSFSLEDGVVTITIVDNRETPVEVDLTQLEELIATAAAISNDDGRYTEESFAALDAAIAEAQVALGEIKTEEDLAAALEALQAAIDGLVEVEVGDDNGGDDDDEEEEQQPGEGDDDDDDEEDANGEDKPDDGDDTEDNQDSDTDDDDEEQEDSDTDDDQDGSDKTDDSSEPDDDDTESADEDKKDEQELPKTGTASSASTLLAGALSLISGLGLAFKRKKKD